MDFRNTRALLVGAGGIGCELLKTLCLHNLKEIFIVSTPLHHFINPLTGRLGYHRPLQFESPIPVSTKPYQKVKGVGIVS
jgi:hypothetical protein